MRRWVFLPAAILVLSLAPLGACGGDDDDDDSQSSYRCCLNGQYFACADSAAMSTCSLAEGARDCTRDSSKDNEC